jgi:two-component system, NtrC family, sensor kinase
MIKTIRLPSLKDFSINTKLRLLVLVAGGVALLLSTTAFVINDVNLIRSSKIQQLSALAKVLGFNSTAALTFDDPATARGLLSSLSMQPTVRFACIYNARGMAFATYRRELNDELAPPNPREEGYEFVEGNYLDVTQDIVLDGEKIGTVYLRATMDDLYEQLMRYGMIVIFVMGVSLGAAILLASRLQRIVSAPILRLANTAQMISANGDYAIRVHKEANDELGTLYDEFNLMLDRIQRGEDQLQKAHNQLEIRVEERTRQLSETNEELSKEVAERARAEKELATVHQQLLETARRAGMAEIATGVLHNVGNVLNSINVSATLVADHVRNSKLSDIIRALDLMRRHSHDLGSYLVEDEKGKQLPGFLYLITSHLERERGKIMEEMHSLSKNIDHIKAIVSMQQSYAGVAGIVETLSLADLLDDALKLNSSSFDKYDIRIIREYADLPEVRVEKQKLLQILVNLVTNAKDSLIESSQQRRRLTARIRTGAEWGNDRVYIDVIDNGVGIPQENLTRIFSHGFTTKRHGHGFGLHSSANAAKELGGTLTARSDGFDRGAVFTVELPLTCVEVLV